MLPSPADGLPPVSDVDHEFVPDLPDLIDAAEYESHPDGRLMRFQLRVTDDGVQVLGDAFRPTDLEAILRAIDDGPIEQMLCG